MSIDTEDGRFGDVGRRWEDVRDSLFHGLTIGAALIGVVALVLLLADVIHQSYVGMTVYNIDLWQFLTEPASRRPEQAGMYAAIVASVWLMALTTLFAFFLGVGTAVYLEEYAGDSWATRLIEANLANLAGVPSVVYGLLALALVVNGAGTGPIVLAGAIALALLVVPIIIVSAQEALRAVPDRLRQGSMATGATRWQTIKNVVLPAAMPGILTGTILALARAIGETAPLIMVGILFTARTPPGPLDRFNAMPSQIYIWAQQPSQHFIHLAAVGILVLLIILFVMNAIAVLLRNHYEKDL